MNSLGVDFGYKRIGLAIAINGVISPLAVVKNDTNLIPYLKKIIAEYSVEYIYVGLAEGEIVNSVLEFVKHLGSMLKLPIETVEESVSTIEAEEIFQQNRQKNKNYKKMIDAIAAAVILRRALG